MSLKVHLKYVKEVLAGGLITSQYEQEGLKTQHQITSDGQINAQAEIEWEEVEERVGLMESRRLKIKNRNLKAIKNGLWPMPSVKRTPLYMLGDWLLTLCALGIILVEEIYKFFRYRLNLDSFSRF